MDGQGFVVGYFNANQKAEVGEFRTFATDADGVEQFYTWMKSNGTMEIGGSVDNLVRYSELETAFNQLKQDFDSLVTAYNSHIHITSATVGPTPVPGVIAPTTSTGQPSSADITMSKIEEIKTL